MASHDHDDFSFLPTVDSADEEGVIKDELWSAKRQPVQEALEEPYHGEEPHAEVPHHEELHHEEPHHEEPHHEEPHHEEPHHEEPYDEVPYNEEVAYEEPHHEAPPPAKKGRVFEPDLTEHAPQAAPEERMAPVAPRRADPSKTPAIAFGGPVAEQKFTPMPPAPLSTSPTLAAEPPPIPQGPAPLPETESPAIHTGLAADPEMAPADNSAELKLSKKRALWTTLGVHLGVILILLLMHVPMMDYTPPEIVATSEVEELENESWKKVTAAAPQTSPMAASISPLLSTGVSDMAMPAVDFSATTSDLNLGTSFGSFGSGVTASGAGGKVSFLGNTATARHVVFVVDVSGSMSASMNVSGSMMTRFDLLKRELNKSISALAAGTAYQVLFFSDFAWPHDGVDSNNTRALKDYEWDIAATSVNAKIPRFSYLAVTPANISKSKKIILESNNPGGTNWGSGLMMALKGNPKPDVIFFMTDGNRSDEQGWIDAVTEANSRGKRTIIHTTALGTPDAARDLDLMAKRNGGKFTAVMADGKIVQGKDIMP